jgi:hypothetical protein
MKIARLVGYQDPKRDDKQKEASIFFPFVNCNTY